MFTNASQKYRRYITDHLSEQSAIVTECSANIRLYRRCFGEHSPNHRKSIFFIGTAGIYAQNRKASGSIACIIIHFTIADAKIPNGTEALMSSSLKAQRSYPFPFHSRDTKTCSQDDGAAPIRGGHQDSWCDNVTKWRNMQQRASFLHNLIWENSALYVMFRYFTCSHHTGCLQSMRFSAHSISSGSFCIARWTGRCLF